MSVCVCVHAACFAHETWGRVRVLPRERVSFLCDPEPCCVCVCLHSVQHHVFHVCVRACPSFQVADGFLIDYGVVDGSPSARPATISEMLRAGSPSDADAAALLARHFVCKACIQCYACKVLVRARA